MSTLSINKVIEHYDRMLIELESLKKKKESQVSEIESGNITTKTDAIRFNLKSDIDKLAHRISAFKALRILLLETEQHF